jgi:predicted S18 family serine protease
MSDYSDLVKRLRGEYGTDPWQVNPAAKIAADAIELLQRELKCSKEMWEQQQELALEYLADIEKANERIAELEQEIDDYETTYKGSVVEAQAKEIHELKIELAKWVQAWRDMGNKVLRDRIDELEAALEDERERCAKIAEQFLSNNEPVRLTASSIAAAIRERTND